MGEELERFTVRHLGGYTFWEFRPTYALNQFAWSGDRRILRPALNGRIRVSSLEAVNL
jgi:hypothetical protein